MESYLATSYVFIQYIETTTIMSIMLHLNTCADLTQKFADRSKEYVLIFDEITGKNPHILEFIRMLLETSEVVKSHHFDLQSYDVIKLHHFNVVGKYKSYLLLSTRFMQYFLSIRISAPFSLNSNRYAVTRALNCAQSRREDG